MNVANRSRHTLHCLRVAGLSATLGLAGLFAAMVACTSDTAAPTPAQAGLGGATGHAIHVGDAPSAVEFRVAAAA